MASVNEPGVFKIVVDRAGGGRKEFMSYRSDSAIHAGKSPDGVAANLTSDKLMKVARLNPPLRAGDIIRFIFKSDAADGIDISDGIYNIPYWENGSFRPLNADDFGMVDISACPADGEIEFGTGYTIPANVTLAQLGGGDIQVSIEDDTA